MKKLFLFLTTSFFLLGLSQNKKNRLKPSSKLSNEKIYRLQLGNGIKNTSDFNLAGLKSNSKNYCYEKTEFYSSIPLIKIKTKELVKIHNIPTDLKAFDIKWSPNYERIAFCNATENGIELWYFDLFNMQAKKMDIENLNAYFGTCYGWLYDSNSFVIKQFANPSFKVFNPTNASFLNTNDLIKEFKKISYSEFYSYSLLGEKKLVIKADHFSSNDFSPDGHYILVSKINTFDKDVIYKNFNQSYEVFNAKGNFVKKIEEHDYFHPKEYHTVRTEKRNILWKSDKGSSLTYVIAVDGGEVQKNAEYRDELWIWEAPFKKEPQLVMKSMNRLAE